jgi:hypothetical protein
MVPMKISVRRRRSAAGTPQKKSRPQSPQGTGDRVLHAAHLRTALQKTATPEPAIDTPAAQLAWHRRELLLIEQHLATGSGGDVVPLLRGVHLHRLAITRLERQGVARV